MTRFLGSLMLIAFVALPSFGCANKVPPNLTTSATIAWHNTQVQKVLDLVRDTAVAANAQTPPLVSTDTTRKVVEWHKATIVTLHGNTGTTSVLTGITNSVAALKTGLPAAELSLLNPYFTLLEEALK